MYIYIYVYHKYIYILYIFIFMSRQVFGGLQQEITKTSCLQCSLTKKLLSV